MTKKEFLNILYEQLSDQMPEAKASAHTQYYHDYIQDAIKRGQKEKQVLDSLEMCIRDRNIPFFA